MYYWGIIKLLDPDIVASLIKTAKHCLLAEQLSWLTTQDRLKRKYWTFTTFTNNKRSSYIVDWDCSPHLFPHKQHIWLTHQVGRIKSWHTDAGAQVATLNHGAPTGDVNARGSLKLFCQRQKTSVDFSDARQEGSTTWRECRLDSKGFENKMRNERHRGPRLRDNWRKNKEP